MALRLLMATAVACMASAAFAAGSPQNFLSTPEAEMDTIMEVKVVSPEQLSEQARTATEKTAAAPIERPVMTDAFHSNIFRLPALDIIDPTTRLDMVEYYINHSDHKSTTRTNDETWIAEIGYGTSGKLKVERMVIRIGENSSVELVNYLNDKGETVLYAAVTTVALPAESSDMRIFNSNGDEYKLESFWKKPTLNDFLTKEGRKQKKDLAKLIDFLLYRMNFDNSGDMTLTLTLKDYMSKEDYEKIKPFLVETIHYRSFKAQSLVKVEK